VEQREDETRAKLKIHRRVIAGWCLDPNSVVFDTVENFAAGSGLMMSGPMAFTLLAGNSYSFGLLQGLATGNFVIDYHAPPVLVGQNGLTPEDGNENWNDFGAPVRVGDGGVTFAMRLDGTQGSVSAAPEPASIALMGTGLLGVAGFARRRRKQV